MGNVKPWQVAIMVVAFVAVAVSGYLTFGPKADDPRVGDRVFMADASTGELFSFRVGGPGRGAVFPPETNPSTGKRSLVPVYKDGETWRIAKSDRFILDEVEGGVEAVDRSTLEVRVVGEVTKVR